ncbi:MAG TPA: glycosyltransferase [Longimicrobiales bacterium]
MKVCSLTQSYAPTGGGIRTMLHAQREWFRERGMQHVLIVPGAADTVSREGRLTTCTIASPHVPGSSVYRLLLRSDKVLRILRDEMPDVIEVHCTYNLPWTAFLHRKRHGAIVTGFYMTDLPVAYVEAPLRKRAGRRIAALARAGAERYVRALYSRCDFTVAISPATQQRLHQVGVRDALCVPLGVDTCTFSPGRRSDTVRERVGAARSDLLLVYAGRLDAEKRPDLVCDAFELLPPALDARLVIAGDGPMRAPLEARAAANDRIRVLPFIQDRAELAALLASADVYVSAMAYETFGLSVVEAQASGLPVVGVRAGAMIDRVRHGEDGFLVEPESAPAIARCLADTPRELWPALGRRARARVESELSWSRTFEKLLTIYQPH